MPFSLDYLKTPSGILKLLEIILVVTSFGLFRGSSAVFHPHYDNDANFFGCGVLVTALIITPLLLACYLMGRLEIQKTIFEVVFNFLMFVFLLAAGAVAVDKFDGKVFWNDYNNAKSKSLALGSFCIISSFVYLVDTVFAVRLYRE